MIKVSKKILKEYLATIERTIILIEDNKPLKDVEGFYNDELILYELNNIIDDIHEVIDIGINPKLKLYLKNETI